jgi:hypothetical protein
MLPSASCACSVQGNDGHRLSEGWSVFFRVIKAIEKRKETTRDHSMQNVRSMRTARVQRVSKTKNEKQHRPNVGRQQRTLQHVY